MIRKSCYFVAVVILPFFLACSSSTEIPGLDKSAWVKDKQGCNYRHENISLINKHKELLLNKREADIRKALGEPNRQELYVRGQKFFYYTITSPEACMVSDSTALELRFSALGMISEIMVVSY